MYIYIYKYNQRLLSDETRYYGYPGRSVILECVGFVQQSNTELRTLEWTKCAMDFCNSWDSFILSRVEYVGSTWPPLVMLEHDWAHVSTQTGDLTIHKFQEHDKGRYRCDSTGMESVRIHLENYSKLFKSKEGILI